MIFRLSRAATFALMLGVAPSVRLEALDIRIEPERACFYTHAALMTRTVEIWSAKR